MTLPFRRRHNDTEATHDRARALSSRRLLEPLDADDEGWLARHLDACTECRREDEAFAADRELLRSLRDEPIEPPRDLWAKTSAALDVEAKRSPLAVVRRPFWRTSPAGAAAGLAVLVVVVLTALLPNALPHSASASVPPVGAVSLTPGPTPFSVAAAPIGVLRPAANGTFDFGFTDVDQVCPHVSPQCLPPPTEHPGSTLDLSGAKASTVTLSPHNDHVVFESETGAGNEGKILIVPVPTAQPSQAPETPAGASAPPTTPPASGAPSPVPTPNGQIEIASGVTVVGDVAYSTDGKWLAFSAAPNDGSTGPDLYIYAVGSSQAEAVTTDHQTYFSAWLGSQVIASHIEAASSGSGGSGNPKASNGQGNGGQGNGGQGNSGQGQPIDGHASSFLFDPATGTRTELGQPDVWMPVVDPNSRFVAYWSGSLRSTDGVTWQLGDGQLVLDGWQGAAIEPEGSPAESPATTIVGPAGHPEPIVTSHVEDFVARFDPDGIRLAVWVSEHAGATDGRLHLVVIDPATGTINPDRPLSGEPALRRFSIDANRLAWVTPSGQDGQESSLQVLGWKGETFGKIQSEPSADLLILR